MENKKTKKENAILSAYAESVAVDRETLNRGAVQLDAAIATSEQLSTYLDRKNELKKQMLEVLTEMRKKGKTAELNAKLLRIQQEIKSLEAPKQQQFEQIQTQEIVHSFDEMKASNEEFAQAYGLDLSNPFVAAFTNSERAIVSNELAEKFDLLRLDKYDYAFAAAVGLIGGIVDAVLIGTASRDASDMGKLAQLNDKAFDKMVQVYAKHSGWNGPRSNSDPTKSAIGYLEKQFPVHYDQRYAKDIQNILENSDVVQSQVFQDNVLSGMNPSSHHLQSLSHSCSILGLISGVLDLLQGKASFFDPNSQKIVRINVPNGGSLQGSNSIVTATQRWFGHMMSDIAGGSGASGRGAGLPTGVQTVLQSFQFGKIPIKESGGSMTYGTIADVTQKMYENGYDFRFQTATAIPVIICEVIVRLYWFFKQHFYYGKTIKESLPFGRDREMQRLLLITSLSFSTVDVTHAIIKGYAEGNPISFFNSLNLVALVNLGFKLFVNFRLEHEHNEKVRQIIQTEVKQKFDQLLDANYLL